MDFFSLEAYRLIFSGLTIVYAELFYIKTILGGRLPQVQGNSSESDIGHQKDNQGYNERNIQKAFV